ncbi:amidase, Asp-tRNAAsn/Glu-tRNAGln amidotransferase A subunit [Terriglobus roseus DSM 18391]|uniref:Amidase, Asp-tRNAAsn/Glu-tRNAGln amidotransferase A subunit n=1 Tax=Terriglobus roseus (strain DSM 18391 / NRRL B-41598 / KBS 63) TaxID=926566 RepID=I3ZMP0_TERRK|nr:amidase [Terriglobus roseus]AFL90508.1 amidase, Asp-tRNAAsn/Glu-tRNAGln amidotransferase A subunit [Terriglobus roseus DSM 18391]
MRLTLLALAALSVVPSLQAQAPAAAQPLSPPPIAFPANLPVLPAAQQAKMDADLLEIDIPHLQALYAKHKYTVEQVTRWYMGRIARYNTIYRAVQTVDTAGALATAKALDASKPDVTKPLWGVPIVIKANTAVKGLIDSDGWQGFALPGHQFIADKDATVVARLRAAGAVILGITNMPDFAASDTNRSTAFGRTGNAYDVRFSPGGSSGGTVTAVTGNFALLGTGTDTANSIRMPAGTSAVVGVLPTRGLTSIAGIAPLDWLLDNTGPIARNVTDAAIALDVMSGEKSPADPLDFRTTGEGRTTGADTAQLGPFLPYLKKDALKGKRFGVPAFILSGNTGFGVSQPARPTNGMQPETRAMLMKAIDQFRAAGAEVILDDTLLPDTFALNIRKITTTAYRLDGTNGWLAAFGPAEYRSAAAYEKALGSPLPSTLTGAPNPNAPTTTPQRPPTPQVALKADPNAETNYFAPQRAALAEYTAALDRLHLDGLIYPSAQMPPPDETMPQNGTLSSGPHSNTGWVNRIGVPAVVVPAGFYDSGLPFGLEISARPWRDGDLLGWAYAYEQTTKLRRPPVLVETGLLPNAR